ncbi:MAG: hypothetical protein M1813_008984 [Trichoglossum hirsutum]|nr:MAG: hypothetical protein M1813_008984 [Trichoglossum hirsutum]
MKNQQQRQTPPQDVVIPIPGEGAGACYSNEKDATQNASPASEDTWNSAQTVNGGMPPEEPEAGRKAPPPRFTPKTRVLDKCPTGYPRLACFTASDHNFMIYRSFSYLHARCLLYIQDELASMERDLDELDEGDEADEDEGVRMRLRSRGREDWVVGERVTLVRSIKAKLDEYDDLLFKAKKLTSFQRPSHRDYKSVRTWFYNEEPLVRREQAYIECKEDLVTLRNGRECAGFDGWVEGLVRMLDCRFTRWLFLTPELRAKTSDKSIHYFSSQRLDTLVALLIAIIILVLLVLPVIALVVLEQKHRPQQPQQTQPEVAALNVFRSIGVLMVFTLTFSAMMSMLTKARRHEVFASSAASVLS